MEINIQGTIINEIIKNSQNGVFENQILEKLEENLIDNMNDTFLRLIVTKEYYDWEEHHKFLQQSKIE